MNNSVSFVLSVVEEAYKIYDKVSYETKLNGWSGVVVDHDIQDREWTRVSILYTINKPETNIVRKIINIVGKHNWEIWEESDKVSQIRMEFPTKSDDIYFLQEVIERLKNKYPMREVGVLKFPQQNSYSLFDAQKWS